MARPSPEDLADIERIETMDWPELSHLWQQIKAQDTPDWRPGKALEHLVIRAFKLGKWSSPRKVDTELRCS